MYGKQAYSMAEEMKITVKEAEEMVEKYLKGKPSVSDFIDASHKSLEDNGYMDTLQGHRRLLRGVFGDKKAKSDAMRQSVNTIN